MKVGKFRKDETVEFVCNIQIKMVWELLVKEFIPERIGQWFVFLSYSTLVQAYCDSE